MDPEMSEDSFIFYTTKTDSKAVITLDPWAIIKKKEVYTAIVTEKIAKKTTYLFRGPINGLRGNTVISRIFGVAYRKNQQ
jgi:hypothetical protein